MDEEEQTMDSRHETLNWKWLGLALFALGFFWMLGYNLALGYGIMSNDSRFYLRHAIGIQQEGFAYVGTAKLQFFYWFLPAILATLRSLFGDSWKDGYLVLQCLFSGAFYLGIYRLAEHLRGWKAGLIVVVLGLVCIEYINWSRYILTDIMFTSIALWFVLVLLKLKSCSWNDRWGWSLLVPLLILVTMARPVGFLFPFAISLYLFYMTLRNADRNWKVVVPISLLLMVAVGAFLLATLWDDYGLRQYFNVFMDFFRDGMVIRNRPEYDLPNDAFLEGGLFAKILFMLEVVLMRCVAFWNPFIIGYSVPHLLFNGLTLFPYFILALYGMIRNFRGQYLALVLILVVVTLFHSVTLIDYDHRYRLPILGFVLVLSGIGLLDGIGDVRRLWQRRIANRDSS